MYAKSIWIQVVSCQRFVRCRPQTHRTHSALTRPPSMCKSVVMFLHKYTPWGPGWWMLPCLEVCKGYEYKKEISLYGCSAGVTGAKAGTLSFLVGGSKQAFARASPILELMGQRTIHCGPAGSGLAAKICNNLMLGVEQIVVAEAMLLGQRLGLDPGVLASVINSSTGACWSSSVNNPVPGALPGKTPPCERGFEGGFATELMIKVGDVKGLFYHKCTQSQRLFVLVGIVNRTWDWQGTYRERRVHQCRWRKRRKGFTWMV